MDHHVMKPAVVERFTNQLQRRYIFSIRLHSSWHEKRAHLKTLAAPDDTFMKERREKEHCKACHK